MSAQVAFGRRTGNAPRAAADGERISAICPEALALHEEIALAARAAFQGAKAEEAPFPPNASIASPKPLDDEQAIRAFIGPHWRSYQRLWERDRPEPRLRSSFGLGPALFGPIWLIYRKQYGLGFLFVAAETASAYFVPILAPIIGLLLGMVVGRYGKSIALRAAAAAAARERRSHGASDLSLRRLREAGGVTLWLPILLMLSEIWWAEQQLRGPHVSGFDAAGLLANLQNALP